MTFRSAEGGAWVARACSQRRRCGAWTGGWFQHWCGWLSLGEALQIQWQPAKTEVAGDGGRRQTVTDGGGTVAKSDDFLNSDSGQLWIVFYGSGQLQTVINSGGWRRIAADGGNKCWWTDQTETRAGSTRSDTKLRLKQTKICLRA